MANDDSSDMDMSSSSSSPDLRSTANKSAGRPDSARFTKHYPRHLMLALARSPKVACPPGLKPLNEWYGEYEPPAAFNNTSTQHAHSGRSTGGSLGTFKDGEFVGGSRGERRQRERPERTDRLGHDRTERGTPRDYGNSNVASSSSQSTGASATGSMGDFRLAGTRQPISSLSGADGTFSNSRRSNDDRGKMWDVPAIVDGERKTRTTGEFVRRDGRAAEEGGWRTTRELKEKAERDLRPSTRYLDGGDKQERPGALRSRSNNRNPAWMDDETPIRTDSSSRTARNPRSNGFERSSDALPAWAREDQGSQATIAPATSSIDDTGSREDAFVAERARFLNKAKRDTSPDVQKKTTPVADAAALSSTAPPADAIQAYKAEMKAQERRKQLAEEREIRREMGLLELSDEALEAKFPLRVEKPVAAASTAPAPSRPMYNDYMMPTKGRIGSTDATASGSTATEGSRSVSASRKETEQPKASRFANLFDKTAQQKAALAAQQAANAHMASAAPPIQATKQQQQQPANPLLAALQGGLGHSPSNEHARSHRANSETQSSDSMSRIMQMLNSSSITPQPAAQNNVLLSALQPPSMNTRSPAQQSAFQTPLVAQEAAFHLTSHVTPPFSKAFPPGAPTQRQDPRLQVRPPNQYDDRHLMPDALMPKNYRDVPPAAFSAGMPGMPPAFLQQPQHHLAGLPPFAQQPMQNRQQPPLQAMHSPPLGQSNRNSNRLSSGSMPLMPPLSPGQYPLPPLPSRDFAQPPMSGNQQAAQLMALLMNGGGSRR